MNNRCNNVSEADYIDYLDLFYEEAVSFNNEKKRQKRKTNIKRLWIALSYILLIASALFTLYHINVGIFNISLTTMPLFFAILINLLLFLKTKEISPNTKSLQEYLQRANLNSFSGTGPRCLTNGTTSNSLDSLSDKNTEKKLLFFMITPTLLIGAIIPWFRFGVAVYVVPCLAILPFLCLTISFFVSSVMERHYIRAKHLETVYAVCVENDARYSRSNGHITILYRPTFYAKCQNGHKYLLFNDIYSNFVVHNIGDIVKLKIDSSNPFNFTQCDKRATILILIALSLNALLIWLYIYNLFQ